MLIARWLFGCAGERMRREVGGRRAEEMWCLYMAASASSSSAEKVLSAFAKGTGTVARHDVEC